MSATAFKISEVCVHVCVREREKREKRYDKADS